MNRVLFVLLVFVFSLSTQAQYVLGRQTMSCFSIRACDELCINSTAGQIDFGTMNNTNTIFTPGFEQTEGGSNLYPTMEFKRDECSGHITASVIQTFGCDNADSIRVFWDGMPANFTAQLTDNVHVLRMESNTGCTFEKTYDFDGMEVESIPCGLLFYNYCSPNGDGNNDFWKIGNIGASEFSENEVVILNRWGAEVWKAKNYNNEDISWNGQSSDGNALPDGTYFYRLKIATGEYTGYIELLR